MIRCVIQVLEHFDIRGHGRKCHSPAFCLVEKWQAVSALLVSDFIIVPGALPKDSDENM